MAKLEIAIGDDDFDGIICDLDDDEDQHPGPLRENPRGGDWETRHFVVKAVLLSAIAATAVTGGYGLLTENWLPVGVVWAVAFPLVVAIVKTYVGILDGVKVAFNR